MSLMKPGGLRDPIHGYQVNIDNGFLKLSKLLFNVLTKSNTEFVIRVNTMVSLKMMINPGVL